MIISRISMGLGNQMFKYAAGKSLALHCNVPFKVDVSSYEGYDLRRYELEDFFELEVEKASKAEVLPYLISHPVKKVFNKFRSKKIRLLGLNYEEPWMPRLILQGYDRLFPPHKQLMFNEPQFHYSSNFFKAKGNNYLNGYWMSWKYFKPFEEEIKKDFTVKRALVQHLDTTANDIKSCNSVSLHIRRGDFATAKNASLHGLIPIEFYHQAIDILSKKWSNIRLYIFSDDIRWVKENLKTNLPVTYVSNELTHAAIEDFYLMTLCRHNIIANSTFSWWAAYLNSNPEKNVIAPRKWYNKSPYNYKDVYPLDWIILN